MTDRAQPAPTGECKGCYFYYAATSPDFGLCKRFPPSTVYNPKAHTVDDQITTQHVTVMADDWCGEYFPVTDLLADANSPPLR